MRSLIKFPRCRAHLMPTLISLGAFLFSPQLSAAGLAGDPHQIGDPDKGRVLIHKLGCGSCHTIPGVLDAHGKVGPPLEGMASRQYVAGMLRNTPDNMVQWLRFPQTVVPGNAMPNLGISNAEAHQIAAYLATLQ
jgi:cytochrome c2